MSDEPERIRRYYLERAAAGERNRYSLQRRAHLYTVQSIERDLLGLLHEFELDDLSGRQVLDVGCGDGVWLRRLALYGAEPANLYGVELLPERAAVAQTLTPGAAILAGTAEHLPFASGSFDIVMQFVMLSSILDKQARRRAAREMLRVLRPGGTIISYDFIFNPLNRHTRGLPQREYRRYFPDCIIHFHRVTLAPPVTGVCHRLSWILCELLEKIVFLRSHYFVIVRRLT